MGLDNRKKLNLEYTLDMVGDGKQAVEIYWSIDGFKNKIKDFDKLWGYGSCISANGEPLGSIFLLVSVNQMQPRVSVFHNVTFGHQ